MRARTVDVAVLYRPETVAELAAGDRVWVVDPTSLHMHAASAGIVFSDRDLAVIVGYGSRGRLTCAARAPRRHRVAARLIERAATQERLGAAEQSLLTEACSAIESITDHRLWHHPVLDGHRADFGEILAGVVETTVAVARGRDRIGPPSDDPQVAAASTAAHTYLVERLAHARAQTEGLNRYNACMHELATTIRSAEAIARIRRELPKTCPRPQNMSDAAANVPSIEAVLIRLDRELRQATTGPRTRGDHDAWASSTAQI